MHVKELPIEVTGGAREVKGTVFKQIEVSPKGYIYEAYPEGSDVPTHYEIFERKENHQERFNIHQVSYPKSNAFGVWAWTSTTKEHAYEIFHQINTRKRKNDTD